MQDGAPPPPIDSPSSPLSPISAAAGRELLRRLCESVAASADAGQRLLLAEQKVAAMSEQLEHKEQAWYEVTAALRAHVTRLSDEVSALKAQQAASKSSPAASSGGGFFSRAAKKPAAAAAASVPLGVASPGGGAFAQMDDSMRVAQEHADLLRLVVTPLEAEVVELRRRLRVATGPRPDASAEGLRAHAADAAAVVHDLTQALAAAKSHSADLEAELHVLKTQRQVLQQELEAALLKNEHDASEHAELKITWQRATESFLEVRQACDEEVAALSRQVAALQAEFPERALAVAPLLDGAALELQIAAERRDHRAKYDQLEALTQQLKGQYDREINNMRDKARREVENFQSEISAQRMQLVTNEATIARLQQQLQQQQQQLQQQQQQRVSARPTAGGEAPGDAEPCLLCANYEYQLVQMQQEVTIAQQNAAATAVAAAAKVAAAHAGIEAATTRHAQHLHASLAAQESELRQLYQAQVVALDAEYGAGVVTLTAGVAALEAERDPLLAQLAELRPAFDAARAAKDVEVARLRARIAELAAEIDKLQADAAVREPECARLRERVHQLDLQLVEASTELIDLRTRVTALEATASEVPGLRSLRYNLEQTVATKELDIARLLAQLDTAESERTAQLALLRSVKDRSRSVIVGLQHELAAARDAVAQQAAPRAHEIAAVVDSPVVDEISDADTPRHAEPSAIPDDVSLSPPSAVS